MIAALLLACAEPPASPLRDVELVADRAPIVDTVNARIDAGDYVYLQLGDRWTVGFDGGAQPGDVATATPIGVARGFASKRTGRTFDELWFVASVAVVPPEPASGRGVGAR